ncbi:hypothetical protein V8G54_030575 [Vigna mungo]|uniref:Retrovirus-related Pol polyprotein from transposon TNT 1-94-like beta-barrel domain-containing protein n=1 Tax=Vigna mungo TaxID=3915 RepID=A0AAQ3MVD4_VIGMU
MLEGLNDTFKQLGKVGEKLENVGDHLGNEGEQLGIRHIQLGIEKENLKVEMVNSDVVPCFKSKAKENSTNSVSYLDSGAINHICIIENFFHDLITVEAGFVCFRDDSRVDVKRCGTI